MGTSRKKSADSVNRTRMMATVVATETQAQPRRSQPMSFSRTFPFFRNWSVMSAVNRVQELQS